MMNGVTVFGSLSYRSAIMGYVHMLGFALNHMSRCVLEPPMLPADLFVLSPGYKVLLDLATVPPPFSMCGLHSRCPQCRFECSK